MRISILSFTTTLDSGDGIDDKKKTFYAGAKDLAHVSKYWRNTCYTWTKAMYYLILPVM